MRMHFGGRTDKKYVRIKINRLGPHFRHFGIFTYTFPMRLESKTTITQLNAGQKYSKVEKERDTSKPSGAATVTRLHHPVSLIRCDRSSYTMLHDLHVYLFRSLPSDVFTRTHAHTYARPTHTSARSLIVRFHALGWRSKRIQQKRRRRSSQTRSSHAACTLHLQQFNRRSHTGKAVPDADAPVSEENKMKWTWRKQNANVNTTATPLGAPP